MWNYETNKMDFKWPNICRTNAFLVRSVHRHLDIFRVYASTHTFVSVFCWCYIKRQYPTNCLYDKFRHLLTVALYFFFIVDFNFRPQPFAIFKTVSCRIGSFSTFIYLQGLRMLAPFLNELLRVMIIKVIVE